MSSFLEDYERHQEHLRIIEGGNPSHAGWRKFLLANSYEGLNQILAKVFCSNQLLYWNVIPCKMRREDETGGLFVELLRNRESNAIFLLCAPYVSTAGYHNCRLFKSVAFSHLETDGEYSTQVREEFPRGGGYTVTARFAIESQVDVWRMQSLDISRTGPDKFDLDWNHRLVHQPEALERGSPQETLIPCPQCVGRHGQSFFAIPKASLESGLSGYALFSENTIAGWLACTNCGGQGGTYKDWFQHEYPEKCTADLCIPGTGLVPYQPLPLVQKIGY